MLGPADSGTFVIRGKILVDASEQDTRGVERSPQFAAPPSNVGRLAAPRVVGGQMFVGQLVGRGGPAGEEVDGLLGVAAGFGDEDR
jgi:hypothetical protein